MLEVLVNNIEKNVDINIEKSEKLEYRICISSQLRKLECIGIVHNSENFRSWQKIQGRERCSRNLI